MKSNRINVTVKAMSVEEAFANDEIVSRFVLSQYPGIHEVGGGMFVGQKIFYYRDIDFESQTKFTEEDAEVLYKRLAENFPDIEFRVDFDIYKNDVDRGINIHESNPRKRVSFGIEVKF
ncbi:hypothetical protein EVB55_144 [Rhizobium phage RHph_Y68]|uniref:Uncharacterized protein n=1 Tax=Rhizobium phage RHph_Y68 TaxID=2509787 RepID=A0A7S5USZ0_9CAUD|nr:hypothetical protein PP934_gp144 [Rhizobium phage RHph_Y68]QIG68079.1 hypothetical protein EVB55_144 [Rhizobium phage RHph_Y68]